MLMNSKDLLKWAVTELGVEKRLEAELLLCHVLNTNRALLMAHDTDELETEQVEMFRALVVRRKADEPLQYLLGTANFMGLELLVTPAVLIPRFDTERLVEKALKLLEDCEEPAVLDVCTGSGAIALALQQYKPKATVYAGDLSGEALAVAMQNNARCGLAVQFRQGNLLEPFADLTGKLDLLASNPPYITTQEMGELPGDVLQEPRLALWGGNDGLYFYRKITAEAGAMLKPGGWLIFEIGWTQGPAVEQLLKNAGFEQTEIIKDWQGLDRVVCGRKPE
ncbi:MAG: peptide chain release factor N(5)-glutamine methyltransferase [Peptococcaceae bacterium]|jgi:release factor glutamine methyltransferase|nr:peptide chain release factor N(5)-glutamine methyltransferase [Peptococcaceae bacterium]MBQ2448955.1 peptide chain release factor N(5)-glutamine methyltransferase [Peptococcaceae bacterium]